MKGISFLKGCAVAMFGLAFARLRNPIVENQAYNTHIDWFDFLLVVSFGLIYCFFLDRNRAEKQTISESIEK